MGPLDHLCRFCSQELDRPLSKNIFVPENSHLLKTAMLCIPAPMSADDRYPKFACSHCAFKLNIVTEFQDMGLSTLSLFDEILAKEESKTSVTEPLVQVKVEVLSDVEFVEEDGDFTQGGTESKLPKVEGSASDCNLRLQNKRAPLILGPKKSSPTKKDALQPRIIQCAVCFKSFSRQNHLSRHMITHSGEKPNQCRVCEKCFSRGEHLERHMFSHLRLITGERPFQCQVCNNSYTRKDHLNRHRRKKGHAIDDCVDVVMPSGTVHF